MKFKVGQKVVPKKKYINWYINNFISLHQKPPSGLIPTEDLKEYGYWVGALNGYLGTGTILRPLTNDKGFKVHFKSKFGETDTNLGSKDLKRK